MAQQTVNIGSSANKGDGDPLRTAFTKINENFTELYADIAALEDGNIITDVKGNVFAEDSTLLVDAINGVIPAANLSGALPALDGSALTNITLSTADITGYGVFTGTEETFDTLTGATGTVTHNCDTGHIFYHDTPAADWTANFTNLDLSADRATTLALVVEQGATAYIPNAMEIEGVSQTILWQDGSVPSGNANGTDVISFSILNRDDSTTYVVMGQLVGFS